MTYLSIWLSNKGNTNTFNAPCHCNLSNILNAKRNLSIMQGSVVGREYQKVQFVWGRKEKDIT
jgi:hypothetical protein